MSLFRLQISPSRLVRLTPQARAPQLHITPHLIPQPFVSQMHPIPMALYPSRKYSLQASIDMKSDSYCTYIAAKVVYHCWVRKRALRQRRFDTSYGTDLWFTSTFQLGFWKSIISSLNTPEPILLFEPRGWSWCGKRRFIPVHRDTSFCSFGGSIYDLRLL